MTAQDRRPFAPDAPDLMADLMATLGRLLRGEIALARAEMAQGLRAALRGVAMVLGAVVLLVTAIPLFARAGVAGLVHAGLRPWQAELAFGTGLVLVAAVLGLAGLRRIRPETLLPQRALAGLRRDAETIKQEVNPDAPS